MITRIAPTPSGYLHVGNCVNFLLVDGLARQADGRVVLRIDDFDADRYRSEYVDDIFRVLEWLRVPWDDGPRSRAEFEREFSASRRREYYRSHLDALTNEGVAYACACSRADLRAARSRSCVNHCRERGLPLAPGSTALRVHVPPGTFVDVDNEPIDLCSEAGDFVVWRRDDLPAYQLASLIEDRDRGVTHVVRGADLRTSTAAQLFLAPYLDASTFSRAVFVHHGLLTDNDGMKLSKSRLDDGPMILDAIARERVLAAAATIGEQCGITLAAAPR